MDLQQASLSGGELTPSAYGRVDLARYATSLRTLRNFVVRAYGGVDNRPGTQYIGEVKDSDDETILVPFQFSQTQNYVLEFGDQYIRFYSEGAQIESGGSPVEVATPYVPADLPDLRFTQSADVMTIVHPSHAPRKLARASATSWTLEAYVFKGGPFLEMNSDTSIRVLANADRGKVSLVSTQSIFEADHVGGLFYIEPSDLSKVPPWEANKQIAKNTENPYGQVRRNDGKYYRCITDQTAGSGDEYRTGNVPPTHDQGVAADGDGKEITAGGTTYAEIAGMEWEYLHSGYGIMEITSYTNHQSVVAQAVGYIPTDCVSEGGATLTARDGGGFSADGIIKSWALTGATSEVAERYLVYDDGGYVYDLEEYAVEESGGTYTIYFNEPPTSGRTVSVDQYADDDGLSSFWAFGAWSDEYGYPSAVTYFSDRLTFSNTPESEPQTTWLSKAGNYTDFGKSVPHVDDDALTFTINARQINPIVDLVPLKNMVLLTQGAVWSLSSTEGGIIAPGTVRADPEYYQGAKSNVRAEVIGNTALYVQSQGESIRDLAYLFDADGYEGDDLTLLAEHLFSGFEVKDISWQQVPYQCLWSVRSDGKLLSMTYIKKESINGWAQHDTDGDSFERVCVIPEGNEDYAYFVIKRTVDGSEKRYVERMVSRRFADVDDAWFVDSGLQYDGENTNAAHYMTLSGGTTWEVGETLTITATGGSTPFAVASVDDIVLITVGAESVRVRITIPVSPTGAQVVPEIDIPVAFRGVAIATWTYQPGAVSGLDHLEGRTVAVLNDGNEEERKVVSAGVIGLDRPGGKVIVGLPIEADIETLDVNVPGKESITAKTKLIPEVGLVVRASRGIWAGPNSGKLREYKQRNDEHYLDPVTPLTGTAIIPIDSSWSKSGRIFIRQNSPLPLSVLGIIPRVEVGE